MTGCLYFEAFYGNYVLSARNATKIREEMKHIPPSFYSHSLMSEPPSLHVMHSAQARHRLDATSNRLPLLWAEPSRVRPAGV